MVITAEAAPYAVRGEFLRRVAAKLETRRASSKKILPKLVHVVERRGRSFPPTRIASIR
jgi:hypothetical protein